jgi:predicted AAA+ superfamily ATPase
VQDCFEKCADLWCKNQEKRVLSTLKFSEKCVTMVSPQERTGSAMKRKAIQDMIHWKQDEERKPLVLRGARQVGKTWLMKEFGQNYYKRFVYFNFDEEDALKSIFETNKNPQRIIELLSMISGEKILPGETLLILDEIQECPEALNTLKYFKEKANEYHVIAAGSLLGTLLAKPKSYPVGMVNLLDIYPLSFEEFLEATDPALYVYYDSIQKEQQIEEIFHNRLLECYNNYLIIGGMPECVASWIRHKDPARISQIQRELVEVYENDFSKHNGKVNSGRILMVFRSIVAQLAKPNEKFMYGAVREGGRARDFEEAIEWLVSAGMLNRVYNVSKMEHPLSAFDKLDQFKLFVFDTGLLKHMAGIDNSAILLKADYQFKGPLTENYVLQQFRGQFEIEPRYYSDKNSEIDFVLQNGMEIIPVEAKGGEDKSAPSFKRYIADNHPEHAIRFSKRGYRKDGAITNIPLYLAGKTKQLL